VATDSLSHPLRAALYARVSTSNGHQDPQMQLRELREYAARRGWQVIAEYVDQISSSKERRPELDKLLAECRKRKFDAVVVYRYDRFARSLRQLVNALAEFDALGIQFVSLHEGVDTSTPNGRLVFGIFASIAEFERELIRERVRSGLAHARAKGKKLGRPGHTIDPAKVLALRASGESIRDIATQLNSSVGTVSRVLAASTLPTQENVLEMRHA
jgi:DNA invertase Pin-like site-specific DNA recombinase